MTNDWLEGVKLKSKADSKMMRFIGKIISPFNKTFMDGYWTTWFGTIYAPTTVDVNDPVVVESKRSTIEHEKVHLKDQKKHPILFPLTYVLPPVLLAYGRWYWERKAYLVTLSFEPTIEDKLARIERITNALGGSGYLWTWPKPWIRKWFRKELGI